MILCYIYLDSLKIIFKTKDSNPYLKTISHIFLFLFFNVYKSYMQLAFIFNHYKLNIMQA